MKIIKIIWCMRAIIYGCKAKIGKYSYIGKPVFISNLKDIQIGERVRIYPGIRVETFDKGIIICGNNISIGQNFHVVSTRNKLTIGDNVTISGNVFVSNCDHTFDQEYTMALEQPLKYADTSIGSESFIGYGAVILAGTHLGKHCIVGANSVVRGKFPDGALIVGNPARLIKRFDSEAGKWIKE